MKRTRRIILQTKTYERISLRKTSKITETKMLQFGIYQLEISKIEAEGKQIIFEAEILGSIEIAETNEEIRLVCRKK